MNSRDLIRTARKLRAYMEACSAELTDEQAIDLTAAFPSWTTSVSYTIDERVRYDGKLYKCVQAHTSQSDWTPDVVPALWTEVSPAGVVPEWKQPIGTSDAYMAGDVVMYNGVKYISTADTNVWSPETYGWIAFTG